MTAEPEPRWTRIHSEESQKSSQMFKTYFPKGQLLQNSPVMTDDDSDVWKTAGNLAGQLFQRKCGPSGTSQGRVRDKSGTSQGRVRDELPFSKLFMDSSVTLALSKCLYYAVKQSQHVSTRLNTSQHVSTRLNTSQHVSTHRVRLFNCFSTTQEVRDEAPKEVLGTVMTGKETSIQRQAQWTGALTIS